MNDDTNEGDNRRARTMRFRVSAQEADEIESRAGATGLTLSAYLRAAALHHRTRSVYDLDAVADLVRVNGDLGRVAGLLKLWLAERRGQGARPVDVEQMMDEFRALQRRLTRIMGQALK